ncbi:MULTISPECIES: NmrA family NAD(P)-binding protein [unclassified Mesorhizobium]|uniref:NmrA family NAD(P)-binding protein n=1 Tax=unclassified Mesorhizobium TaxID=325217 RepID=UPI001128D411|nr:MULTISPECIES: NmrA family NAD(P)-binding protein [unclassified Mesorhizobium]MBZ9811752.1 NmrA family NAD(P)-binding protein [Mesorhizobium sp. ESP-6-2]TPM26302.1 NAD-dependent epimerase/dehydratase family protein [Mesorhizobium sp. B2-2-2]
MYIILGGTGHVGSAAAIALLRRGQSVTVVTRDAAKAAWLVEQGAEAAEADVGDSDSLRDVLRRGKRAFVLNPPADPATDTDAEERRTVAAIVGALKGSGLEKIVAQSTYGAQTGERVGDLTVLHELEERLDRQPIPASIIRAAYYMSNWNPSLETAKREGVVNTLLPPGFKLPMVAPRDLGEAAARLLVEPAGQTGMHNVEGPSRYSAQDVAAAFGEALGKEVRVAPVPRERWVETFQKMGFSPQAAQSYARMTQVTVDTTYDPPTKPERGAVTLERYVRELVEG